jgi:hypothetical protein
MTTYGTVRVGGADITVRSFSLFKALTAGRQLAGIIESVGGVQEEISEFVRQYRETKGTTVMSRAVVEMERPEVAALISDEAWEAADSRLELPNEPSGMEIAAIVLPRVLAVGEERVLRLIALVVADEGEVEQASRGQRLDEYLDEQATDLKYKAELAEFVELATAVANALSQELPGKIADLRKAMAPLLGSTTTPESPATTEPEAMEDESGESSNSTSSIDSEAPTAGADETSSTTSPSPTPAPSPSA